MSTPFRTERRVEFADTDMAGIVHFARFFCYLEAAEHEFLRSIGLEVKMQHEGATISFPRVSARCDYRKPAYFQDVLTITVVVQKLGTKAVTYGFEVLREEELLAEGSITTVCCRIDEQGMHGVVIPELIRNKLVAADHP